MGGASALTGRWGLTCHDKTEDGTSLLDWRLSWGGRSHSKVSLGRNSRPQQSSHGGDFLPFKVLRSTIPQLKGGSGSAVIFNLSG